MLYMVISTHNPESCPMVNAASMEKIKYSFANYKEITKKYGVNLVGMWTDMGAHTSWMVCDAPKAEVLGQMAFELRMMDWNTSTIHPITGLEETMAMIEKMKK